MVSLCGTGQISVGDLKFAPPQDRPPPPARILHAAPNQGCSPQGQGSETRHLPHDAPFVRDASTRIRHRYPHRPKSHGACQCRNNDDLPACDEKDFLIYWSCKTGSPETIYKVYQSLIQFHNEEWRIPPSQVLQLQRLSRELIYARNIDSLNNYYRQYAENLPRESLTFKAIASVNANPKIAKRINSSFSLGFLETAINKDPKTFPIPTPAPAKPIVAKPAPINFAAVNNIKVVVK